MPEMPVILGSSLSGLLVSYGLSQRGIHHYLVGGSRPRIAPRLGESMNEGASLACWKWLPAKYQQYLYPKSHISLSHGKLFSLTRVGCPRRTWATIGGQLRDTNHPATLRDVMNGLCHLDRANFDPVFYDDVTADPYCHFIQDAVADLKYDSITDRICCLLVGQKQIEQPRFVFDATGARGVLADAANVGRTLLTDYQQVTWTHLIAESAPDGKTAWWLNGTNLFRLDQTNDGFDAIAWLIPMGNRVSLGISTNTRNQSSLTKQERISYLLRAIMRRGIDVQHYFPELDEISEIRHQYFRRHRATGANWLLVGGAFMQLWFPTSSGVSTNTTAAMLAPDLLDNPSLGMWYEQKMLESVTHHRLVDRMIRRAPYHSPHQMYDFWSAWVAGSFKRVTSDLQLVNGDLRSKRLKYQFLKNLAMIYRRHRWFQLATVGTSHTIVKRTADLSEHGWSATGYFRSRRFLVRNWLTGVPRYLLSMRGSPSARQDAGQQADLSQQRPTKRAA